MNIKLIKFTTGEEVVCDVIDDATAGRPLTFKNGLTMVWNGQQITGIPFSMNVEDGQEITVSSESIIFITEPRKDLIDQYKQQFSSIITPPSGIIQA